MDYIISETNDLEEESQSCNCCDILIVDDEEFNVMASQKMIKNLIFEMQQLMEKNVLI